MTTNICRISCGIKLTLALLFSITGLSAVMAQNELGIDTQVSGPVTVCGEDIEFEIEIENRTNSVATDVLLLPGMPQGMVYTGTATGMTQVGSGTSLSFSVPDIAGGEMRTVTFRAKATCELIAFLSTGSMGGNLVHNETQATCKINDVVKQIAEPNGSESYSVLFAEMELTAPAEEKNIAADFINVVESRHITVQNNGLGKLSQLEFYVKTDLELQFQKLELQTSSGNVLLTQAGTPALGYRHVISDFTHTGNHDAFLDEGESIVLKDYVKVIKEKTSIATLYTAQWGCEGAVCNTNSPQAKFTAYIEAIGGVAAIRSNKQILKTTDFCNDTPAELLMQHTNEGSGNAPSIRDAAFNVQWQFIESYDQYPAINHNNSFFIKTGNGTMISIDSQGALQVSGSGSTVQRYYVFNFNNVFNADVDGAGGLEDLDNDGFYDDLPVGVTLSFFAKIKPGFIGEVNLNENSGTDYRISEYIFYNGWSGTLESHYSSPNNSMSFLQIAVRDAVLMGPSDLTVSTTEKIYYTYSISHNYAVHGNDGFYTVELDLPAGVHMQSVKGAGSSLSFLQTGTHVVVADPNMPKSINSFEFEFSLNCNEVGAVVGNIVTNVYYYSHHDCPGTRFKFAAAQKEIYLHCNNCSTVETRSFVVERKTLGWVPFNVANKTHYTYGDLYGPSASIPKVTAATPGIRLDAGYQKDDIQLTIKGAIPATGQSVSNLMAEIKYATRLNTEMLVYKGASLKIGSFEYALPVSYQPERAQVDVTYYLRFPLPLGQYGIPPQLPANTTFELNVNAGIANLPESITEGEYHFSGLRAGFFTQVNGVRTGCPDFGDNFTVIKSRLWTPTGDNNLYFLQNDGIIYLGGLSHFNMAGGNGVSDFPNEVRPVAYINNLTVTLPKGFVFDRSKPVRAEINNNYTSVFDVPLNNAQYQNGDRTIVLSLSSSTLLVSRSVAYYAHVKVDCENPDNIFVPSPTVPDERYHPAQLAYSKYAYFSSAADHQPIPVIDYQLRMVNNRTPNLRLTANSEQEAYSETIKWPVQLCNPFNSWNQDATNTWVAVELKHDDHSTILQGATDEAGVPIPTDRIVFYGAKDADHPRGRSMLIKLGNLPVSACQQLNIVARYKNCEEDRKQDVKVFASWDLMQYPTVGSDTVSIKNKPASCESLVLDQKMYINYKTSALQWEVRKNGSPEVDLCVSVPFEIDLTSTKYADISQLKLWLDLPANAVIDASIPPTYHYPYLSMGTTVPAHAILNENGKTGIDISAILGGGLPGTRLPENKFKLGINLTTSCGFDPGLPIKYTITGFTNCGDPISYTDQRKIKITGVELDDITLAVAASDGAKCFSANNISVSMTNSGASPVGDNYLEVLLPPGMNYIGMLQSDLAQPDVITVDGQVKLLWEIESGYLAPGEKKTISFQAFMNENPTGASHIAIKARTYQYANAHCTSTAQSCITEVTTGQTELSLPVQGLGAIAISHTKQVCAYFFSSDSEFAPVCTIAQYHWDFGDGATADEPTPHHIFDHPGTYTVSLSVNFNCGGCTGLQSAEIQIDIPAMEVEWDTEVIEVTSQVKEHVLNVTASTFEDTWLLDHEAAALQDRNGFLNATQGVWRSEGAYVYDVDRHASATTNIATDGTFRLQQFNWKQADLNSIPNWTKANTVTRYSPFSYEIENRDVLGIYSAALYDYGGHLPSANGVNMRNAEMAFTSFESPGDKTSGNWVFSTGQLPLYRSYPVNSASGNIAIIETGLEQLAGVEAVDVFGRTVTDVIILRRSVTILNNEVICVKAYPENPEWSIMVLKDLVIHRPWYGWIRVRNTVTPAVTASIDNTMAHSGKGSLKITTGADNKFSQPLLQLDSGKTYTVNAWVSVGKQPALTPELAPNLGYDIIISDKNENEIIRFKFSPSGRIIEGWQQVKGAFTCPVNNARVDIEFGRGNGTAWYDDLRLHPEKGNMKSYVYDVADYRLRAILDEENFASFFYYDKEGNLYLTKKETEAGIKTLTENVSHQRKTKK